MNKLKLKQFLEWDYFAWGEALKFWNKLLPSDLSGMKVLELGGRDGGLSIFFAEKGANVTCSDVNGVSEKAILKHKDLGLNNIDYKIINAVDIPYEREFDIIVFKSVLGGVGYRNNTNAQKMALKECHKALKADGMLLFAENSTGSLLHRLLRKFFVKWANDWNYTSAEELNSMMSEANFYPNIKSFGFVSLLVPNEFIKGFLYLLDRFIFNVLPNSLKYINYGLAYKNGSKK